MRQKERSFGGGGEGQIFLFSWRMKEGRLVRVVKEYM